MDNAVDKQVHELLVLQDINRMFYVIGLHLLNGNTQLDEENAEPCHVLLPKWMSDSESYPAQHAYAMDMLHSQLHMFAIMFASDSSADMMISSWHDAVLELKDIMAILSMGVCGIGPFGAGSGNEGNYSWYELGSKNQNVIADDVDDLLAVCSKRVNMLHYDYGYTDMFITQKAADDYILIHNADTGMDDTKAVPDDIDIVFRIMLEIQSILQNAIMLDKETLIKELVRIGKMADASV